MFGRKFPLAIACLYVGTAFAHAQEYRGTLSGTITDAAGYKIPNAEIEAKSQQQTYTAKSDAGGHFVIPFVQPSTYVVTIKASGFTSKIYNNVVLAVSGSVDLPTKLSAGASDTVSVSTEEFQLETQDASSGTVMDPEKVQNLPLNGRQVYQLMALTPGVRFTTTTFGASGNSGTRGWDVTNAYTINGAPGTTNQFMLNGAPVSIQNGGNSGSWTISPTIDAVQEFKVMTVTLDAQYGRVGGGAMNTILKSGTNGFHGTVYDFWRNSVLDANTYTVNQSGGAKPYHNQHQYGFTVGGPILKNKAYFFFSFEGWREVLPAPVLTTVPTADMLPGVDGSVNLTNYLNAIGKTGGIYDPETSTCANNSNPCNTYTRSKFANNTIPASRISPIGVAVLKLYPAPNLAGYQNNYLFDGKGSYKYTMPITRLDYNLTDRTRIYGIFTQWSGYEYRNTSGLSGAASTGNINNHREDWTGVLDVTHTISNSMVADVRASYNRYWNPSPSGAVAAGTATLAPNDLGLTMPSIPTTSRNLAPTFSFGSDVKGPNNSTSPIIVGNVVAQTIFETYDIGPSITHTIGRHSLHYGGEFSWYHDVASGIGQPNGTFSFSTGFTQQNYQKANNDGSSVAAALLGIPNGGSVQWNQQLYESYKYYGAYFQDNWKATEHLSFNLGIRWDNENSPRDRHDRLLAGVCLTCANPINSSVTLPSVLPNGASPVSVMYGTAQFSSSSLSSYVNNTQFWQPKFGFSYSPNRKMVIHGGYALSKAFGIELGASSPFNQTTSYNSSADNGLHPLYSFKNGNPFPNGAQAPAGTSLGGLALVGNSISIDQREHKVPIVQQWTLGIEQVIGGGVKINLAYVGTHAYHLRVGGRNLNGLNPSDYSKGFANNAYLNQLVSNPFYGVLPTTTSLGANSTIAAKYLMVPYPQFYGSVNVNTDAGGFSNYHSFQAKAEKRFSTSHSAFGGISMLSSFTWAKLMDAVSRLNNTGAGLVDPRPYYGIDSGDRPWTFALSGLYNLPFGHGAAYFSDANPYVDSVIGGWQLDWTMQHQGGTPIAFPNQYNYNCGNFNIVPAQRSYKSYLNNSNPGCFSNFPAFSTVTLPPYTTAVRAPYAPQVALGLEKKWTIHESVKFQLKAEAFNAMNTPIFPGPSTSSPTAAPTRNTAVADPNAPGAWSGYGTIGNTQQNFPRQYQLSGKVFF